MTWEGLATVAEIIGAIAIIVTLLYLAKQIRQNSRSMEIAALRDTTAQWNDWSAMLATSPDLAEIVARGNLSFAGLAEPEKLRYGAFVQSFFDNAESFRTLVVDHRVEKDLEVIETIVRRRLHYTGFVEWWEENSADYDNEFVAWIDELRR